ncbi:MAG: hypothetical protein Q8S44_07420 [Flavobacteriaceae bacterium]|nr:hypothetical protein [Flavobacteriaceae bacterium]
MDKSKIAILTTIINFDLYAKSSTFFPEGIQQYIIDGSNGMHSIHSIIYMMKKLKKFEIEWLILADEDVFFEKSELVFEVIEKMKKENYTVCGIRDGGVISHRIYNPYLINTFFTILNLKEIKLIWKSSEVLKNNIIFENEFEDDLKNLKGNYDVNSLYEPYYCFYLWLRRNGKKFLFLESDQPLADDNITNAVYFNNDLIFYHSWYARSYGENKMHTDRINEVMKLIGNKNIIIKDALPILFRDKSFFITNMMRKWKRKIEMKYDEIIKNV